MNGSQRSFKPSMNRRMAGTRSGTEAKVPRLMACRVTIPKRFATRMRKTHREHVGEQPI
jgi:hypothetical protein